jgi:23S rRNA maturation mini-RNase III
MLLNNIAHYNNFSDKLREELTERVKSFGDTVMYIFDISKPNPDPLKYNGDTIWPNLYTLDPAIFSINDPHENRDGKSRSKLVALIDNVDEKGIPNRFIKIRLHGRNKGILRIDLTNDLGFNQAMYLEIHPKHQGGIFSDKTKAQVFRRIDETSAANEERALRSARKLAMDTAEKMTTEEVYKFADAMLWDIGVNELVLRNKVEKLAEEHPVMFNDIINDKKTNYKAVIKRAIDNGVLVHSPMEGKLMWASSLQNICVLGINNTENDDIDRFAQWFMTAGDTADEAFKKIESMLKGKKKAKTS